ncbi:dormancy-associated protein homolog 3-like isoform X2 [Actinidia eriantha]|uniref:dormancy-associated protein homolog 3-like isoform X2 n=1 Tax=Actinidia eriantha TaxID=165200 RepID=UPI002586D623|nr:dormancy-associated protein homolog 3-like isoform X2 [Actinidia eriantha]
MSLLDQLWDDTVAGPRPDSGLGKLRKQPSFTPPSRSGKESDGGGSKEEGLKVTRRIMIVKPPITQSGSPPVSPAGSTPPEGEKRIGCLGGGLYRMLTRKEAGLDPGALVLLMTCDI